MPDKTPSVNYPCACRECKRRSAPRPLGSTPPGWEREDGYYVCARCMGLRYLAEREAQGLPPLDMTY